MSYKKESHPNSATKSAILIALTAIAIVTGIVLLKNYLDPKGTHRRGLIDNRYVKAWKTTIIPNDDLKMHRHEMPRIIVPLKGGKLNRTEYTGEMETLVYETGQAYWEDADIPQTQHAVQNPGKENLEFIVIEFKEDALANYKRED